MTRRPGRVAAGRRGAFGASLDLIHRTNSPNPHQDLFSGRLDPSVSVAECSSCEGQGCDGRTGCLLAEFQALMKGGADVQSP